jgi:hypothetical protein
MQTAGGEVESVTVVNYLEHWVPWPISWSAVWVGALAALALTLIIGLVGIALGAHELVPGRRIVHWREFGVGALVFSVFGAFLAFVLGGWVAGKIAHLPQIEATTLHGVIAWLVTVPLLLVLAALGSGSYFGMWLGGLTGTPSWVVTPGGVVAPDAAIAARNAALGTVTALLVGLVGSVLGGWMAAGEPMRLKGFRTRRVVTGRSPG